MHAQISLSQQLNQSFTFQCSLSIEELYQEVGSWRGTAILFLRIAQNMSHFNLLSETMLRAPDAPNLNGTLLLIETNKYFPPSSAVSLDKNVPEIHQDLLDSQISLGQNLKKEIRETISSTSTIKKKKVGCTCKKTKCLKMYCQCFSSDKVCTPECSCFGCSNDHQHSQLVARAKEAVKAKNLSASKQAQGKGCNCKKSQCQKKYCECYNAGLACGSDCKCQDCANCEAPTHSGQRILKGSTSSFLE